MVIVIIMVAACILLVGISYFVLDVLTGMIATPRTRVEEIPGGGELFIPLEDAEVLSMQASADGRFLAYLEKRGGDDGTRVLRVVELGGDGAVAFEREVAGTELGWLGDTSRLVFEDAGDIHIANVDTGDTANLTASPENDSNPNPSPDGRYILWTVSPEAGSVAIPDFWLMGPDGEDKTFLAEAQELAAWEPSGSRIVSRRGTAVKGDEDGYRYVLQTAVPGRPGWEHYADCDGEVFYIWWPRRDTLLYVGPVLVKEHDRVKGVWTRVEQPDRLRRTASTDGLGYDISYYEFCPSRTGERLAYVGTKGLEYLDYEGRVIYRYPELGARAPLAWNEAADEICYVGPGGIRRVAAQGR